MRAFEIMLFGIEVAELVMALNLKKDVSQKTAKTDMAIMDDDMELIHEIDCVECGNYSKSLSLSIIIFSSIR